MVIVATKKEMICLQKGAFLLSKKTCIKDSYLFLFC